MIIRGRKRPRRNRLDRTIRRKVCKFCETSFPDPDYKDVQTLSRFITEHGKIVPAKVSGTCAKHQRKLTNAIKRARFIAFLPFVNR